MIGEGMKVRFCPMFNRSVIDSPDDVKAKSVTGKIIYINWEHKYFMVEFQCGDSKQRESFKFFEIGERVSVIG